MIRSDRARGAHAASGYRITATGVRLVLASGLALGLAGCSSFSSVSLFGSSETTASAAEDVVPPEKLYGDAEKLLDAEKFEEAAQKYEEVDRQHPFSPLARRAIAMAAFAHYKDGKYPEAVQAARRYITLHPGTKEAALAQNIIAGSYYDQVKDPKRDQSLTKKALAEYQELLRRYPESRYAEQARNRVNICMDILAASEMNVGRYYLEQDNHLAAVNRFKVVVKDYQSTAHVEEALYRLTEAYLALGVVSEAQTAAAVLGHNYPNSKWYKDSFALLQSGGLAPREDTGSWISQAWRSVAKAASSLSPI